MGVFKDTGGLRFCSLCSSSRYGNAYVVATGHTTILVDYGVPLGRMERLLDRVGLKPGGIDAIFITHEHSDHSAGLNLKHPLHDRYGIDLLFSTAGTWRRLGIRPHPPFCCLTPNRVVRVGDLAVVGLNKPHDAAEPLAFKISDGTESLGLVTDLGTVDQDMIDALENSAYLIMESNHDEDMERRSRRPASLIRRVLGDRGHLSNDQAGMALRQMIGPDTKAVLLAHLSLECNTPDLAVDTVAAHIGDLGYAGELLASPADSPSPWLGGSEGLATYREAAE